MTDLSYVAEQVRRYDHDRFLTSLFAPAAAREHLLALYAFNIEVAKTREVVTEPLIGQMRLQWWRDALDRIYGGGTIAHETARPLAEAIETHALDRSLFERLIDGREADLTDEPPADLAALVSYCEETAGPLLELALEVLVPYAERPPALAGAARACGTAWAMVGLLRAVPFHAARRRLYLPRDLLEGAGVRIDRLFDLKPDPGLPHVVREIADRAGRCLNDADRARRALPRRARSPLLLGELAKLYLADLRRAGWNPFRPELRRGRPMAALGLAWASLARGY